MLDLILTWTFSLVLCAPRLLGMHMAIPIFSQTVLPPRVRSGLAVALALFVSPLILSQGDPPASPLLFALIVLKEFFLGFAFGLPIALFNWAAQSAGDIISFQSGASMSSFFDPSTREEITPMGSLLRRYAEVLFFISGAYALVLASLFETYRIWPVVSFFPGFGREGYDFFASALGKYFAATCMLAFPAVASMFLIVVCMGLIGRYLPNLNVFVLAMPLQCLAACFILALSFPIYAHVFKGHFSGIEEGLRALRHAVGDR